MLLYRNRIDFETEHHILEISLRFNRIYTSNSSILAFDKLTMMLLF